MDDDETTDDGRSGRDISTKKLLTWGIYPETVKMLRQLGRWLNMPRNKVLLHALKRLYEDEARKHGVDTSDKS